MKSGEDLMGSSIGKGPDGEIAWSQRMVARLEQGGSVEMTAAGAGERNGRGGQRQTVSLNLWLIENQGGLVLTKLPKM